MKAYFKFSCVSILALTLFSSVGFGQTESPASFNNWCGTQVPAQQWEEEMQKILKEIKNSQQSGKIQALYTIPVIIHVIHGGQAVGVYPNLAQGQLHSQIRVLNEDFGGIGYNSGNYPASAYSTWATNQNLSPANLDGLGRVAIANCNIQFCLATKDTLGNTLAEPGIDRINYVGKGWSNPASYNNINSFRTFMDGTVKPQSIWNVRKYLNIWISDVNLNSVGLLGYATFPPLANLTGLPGSFGTATTDGFWCYSRAFGSATYFPNGFYNNGNDRGRTSTHEIGHYVGLRHIWGDGSCVTDYCNDTPPASGQNFGTPTYPFKTTSCGGNSPDGEMFMNIMDYSDDPAKYMFTPDQAARIQVAMANSPYRKFLGTHNLCSVENVPSVSKFNAPANVCGNLSAITLSNNSIGTPVPNYTWSSTGSATFSPNANSNAVTISFATTGTYVVTLTTFNGTISTSSKTINVVALPTVNISSSSPSVCSGDDLTLNATGANSYAWQPGGLVGPTVVYFQPNTLQTYTCIATGAGNCKVTQLITVDVVDCTGTTKISKQESAFSIFPNPANDKLYIKWNGVADNEITLELIDAIGKVMIRQNQTVKRDKNEIAVSTLALPSGIYILKISTADGKNQAMKIIKE